MSVSGLDLSSLQITSTAVAGSSDAHSHGAHSQKQRPHQPTRAGHPQQRSAAVPASPPPHSAHSQASQQPYMPAFLQETASPALSASSAFKQHQQHQTMAGPPTFELKVPLHHISQHAAHSASPAQSRSASRLSTSSATGMSGPSHHMRSAKDADLSPNTRMLLKSMMRSSKLSYSQQRFLDGLVSDAGSLPPRPTASMHQQPGTASPYPYTHGAATPSHAASDRDRDGSVAGDARNTPDMDMLSRLAFHMTPDQRTAARAAELAEWRSKPGIRTLEQIKQTGSYEPERFRTRPLKNMDTEKQRFQDLLEGVEAPKDSLKAPRRRVQADMQGSGSDEMGDGHGSSGDRPDLDEFVMLQQEIAERRQWLDDMIALGRGDQFKRQIQAEIALRVSRLEQIHKERLKQESGGAAAIHAT